MNTVSRPPDSCPLCHSANLLPLLDKYKICLACDLRFLGAAFWLSPAEEASRYSLHVNDIHDSNYRRFLQPACDAVLERIPTGARGLDFGAGPGPLLAKMLTEKGYSVDLYDPNFWPGVITGRYDFICATEVIEHLRQPAKELTQLREHLSPHGVLVIMTHMISDQVDFASWYYRRDPTHIAFYSAQSMRWIQQNLGFQKVVILGDRLAVFTAN